MKQFQIEYFTDPLCCWSWAMEPQMRKLRFLLKEKMRITYVMGGLLKDAKHYSDPMNNINTPAQFGPLWMEARQRSGQPIKETIWLFNPISTSYPACMAVKAAEVQSKIAGEAMLRNLREAVMIHSKNIAETDVLLEVAFYLEQNGIFDKKLFEKCLFSDEAPRLLQVDLNLAKIKRIGRFPTLLISYENKTLQITGYRPFSVLLDTLKLLCPTLKIEHKINKQDYIDSWDQCTQRELEEVTDEENKKHPLMPKNEF